MDYPLRRPWSSSMGSEQAEYSQSHKSIPPPVKECPLRRVSGGDTGIPWSETTQPDMAIRVGEPKSFLHAKPLFDDPKRFDETLQMIDSDLGLTADLVALPKAVSLEGAFNEKSSLPKKSLFDKAPSLDKPGLILQCDDSGL